MKRFYLITLLLLPLLSLAQSNYKSGVVVNLKGDTVRGYINLKEWGYNPSDISFKPTLSGKPQELGLSDITYFEITDYVGYHQYTVSVSVNPVDISAPASPADTIPETRSVFLKVLEKGKNVTLYVYRDDIKERFYIKDNSMAVPVELVFGIFQSKISENVVNKTTYRFQLGQLITKYNSGSDKLITQVQEASYKEGDLIKVVAQINGSTLSEASAGRSEYASVRFFAGLGLISNTIKGGQYYGSPCSTSTVPKITIGADLIIDPATGHFILRGEFAYASNNYTFKQISDPIYNIANSQSDIVNIKQRIITATPQIIYNFYNAEGLKVFLGIGYSVNVISSPPNQVTRSGGTLTSNSGNIYFHSDPNYFTLQLKGGLVIAKRFEIYGIYFPKAALSQTNDYTNELSSYQVGVNYYFGKGAR